MKTLVVLFLAVVSIKANALPAFALKENMSCTVCHTNGSVPHLTKFGYMYRRAGFRLPEDIGNAEADKKGMTLSKHMAAGLNVDYEYVTNKAPGAATATVQSNQFDVREVEIFPVVGSFFGNFGTFSEIDANPGVASPPGTATPPNSTTPTAGGVKLNLADMRYVVGNANMFFNFRGGLIAPEGYGASDQWLDDGNIPLFDQLTAIYNQDTLVLPVGAMESPQMGAEAGFNYYDTHFTVGVYNGFDGTNGLANVTQSSASPVLQNRVSPGQMDYKLQLDQFVGNDFEVTAVYYKGMIPLLDPGNTVVWGNHFSNSRLYLTYSVLPNQVDLFAGVAYGTFEYVNSGSSQLAGNFQNRGAFIGSNYYVMPHLTLGGRLDYFEYNLSAQGRPTAASAGIMASMPFENNVFIFHYSNIGSTMTGVTNNVRLEWRFLF